MNKHIRDIEFVVFDTETTGLSPEAGDRIIEIAAVKLAQGNSRAEFQALVNPQCRISDEALGIHHISNEMLADAPLMHDVMPRFLEFIKGGVLCAYNAGFDMAFLKKELQLLGREFSNETHIIDILVMARKLLPGLERYSLLNVSASLGIRQNQQHRALSDVYMSIEVFNYLVGLLEQKGVYDFENFHTLFGLNSPYLDDLRSQKISRIQEAMDLKVKLKIKYISSQSASVTEREVIPKLIRQESNKYYLIGYCSLRKEERIFAVDGILSMEII